VPPPPTGGGKIAVDPPIAAPIPPQRSVWAIVLPIALAVGVIGFIVSMYVSGMRSFANFGLFGAFMAFGVIGMLFRGRGAAQKMSWGELRQYRTTWSSRLDDVRAEVDVQRRQQWEHRRYFHPEPAALAGMAGSARMWDRGPRSDEFAVVRVGTGKVALAMQIDKPQVPEASQIEPATGHMLRKFLLEQEYIDDVPKAIWLQRFPGVAVVGDLGAGRALARAMICELATFHSPADLQIIIVSSTPSQWDWAKWLPHLQHTSERDGCGERRLLFTSPAKLEAFLDDAEQPRAEWKAPSSGLHGGDSASALPMRIVIDDHCGTPEDWAGLTGNSGYDGTCFVRLAPAVPPPPTAQVSFSSARTWVGFDAATTYRLVDGSLRKRLPLNDPTLFNAAPRRSDELDEAFYATADQMSVAQAERFARAVARWRAPGVSKVSVDAGEIARRTLLDALGVRDPRKIDMHRLWAPRRTQGRDWMRFPVGVDPSGQVVEFDLKEGSQNGMNMHSLFIGTTGAGKSEGIITEVAALALTHSPESVNVVFTDFKLKSAAGVLERFPHVVASVSNLADDRHLVGRMYDALDGELDRRGALCAALPDCPDLTAYNQQRLTNPNLPPVPAMFIIVDEYLELLADPDWGQKFQELFWRIVRLGRAYHMFLQLVGQTVDTQKLRQVRKLIGFTIAARTGREEDSREAIGSAVAAHLPETGAEGTAYLRVAQRPPREYRFFFSSGEFDPAPEVESVAESVRAGTWFDPRTFTVAEAGDPDALLAPPPVATTTAIAAPVATPAQRKPKLVDVVIDSLNATGVGPPRQLWLPPLPHLKGDGSWVGQLPAADELVHRMRGKPWDVDYGDNPGLRIPLALEDRPREHRQDAFFLDLLNDNALIIAAPQRGATTTAMSLVTAGALMYRPERVQFYCIAASGPQLQAVRELPHVAAVAALVDREGVNRVLATVQAIVAERETQFAARGLDMDLVRDAKFGPNPYDIGVDGGDIVLVLDGWANFESALPKHADTIISLMRARNYGVRVVLTHTSYIAGMPLRMKNECKQRMELVLTDWRESDVPRIGNRQPAKDVPNVPGRGVSFAGHQLMVAQPVLAQHGLGQVEVRDVAEIVRRVAGVDKAAEVLRLPESVPMEQVMTLVDPALPRTLVPFGLSETTLGPAFLNFAENQHAMAVGRSQSGRTNFLRVLCRSIMTRYRHDEATLMLIDPRRKLVGVVPDEWLTRYAYQQSDIKVAVEALRDVLEQRMPPPGASQQELLTRRFWSGREIFLIIDDMNSWSAFENPLNPLMPYIEMGADIGLHVVGTADIRNWSQSAMQGVIARIVGTLAPVLIMDGRRDNGTIVSGIYAEPQRPGKAIYVTPNSTDGVLIGWTEPPVAQPVRHAAPAP
jgi:type VII secretion protein EccCa/type VII secretion protein EccCb